MKKISLLAIGGLGIETKQIITDGKTDEFNTLGGSGWHIALTGKALGCQSSIMASIGRDSFGQYIQSTLDKHNIAFQGIISNKTQKYSSIIREGLPIAFSALIDNISTEEIISCFDKSVLQNDILIVGYVHYEILPFLIKKYKNNSDTLLVLDMSDAILSIPNDKIVEYLSEFDIVTMNSEESELLASKLNLDVEQFLRNINSKKNMTFITSFSSIKYVVNKCINTYHFTKIKKIVDTTGAGDAFAVGLAVAKYRKINLEKILQQAIYSAHMMCGIVKKENINKNDWLKDELYCEK